MKKNIRLLFLILIGFFYYIISSITHFYISCPIHFLFHIWCPGCGITRMIHSIFLLDFKQAFRFNQLLFISMPLFLFFFINTVYCNFMGKKPIYQSIPNYFYYIYIVILLIFMIIRNIFPFFAPVDI